MPDTNVMRVIVIEDVKVFRDEPAQAWENQVEKCNAPKIATRRATSNSRPLLNPSEAFPDLDCSVA
jgi:hypothetical protein